ncbi:paraquat-inducible protein A [Litoribrevibacter albus]|uniref:Paraquat-inducible protein A n=1 Tax=Litoribrevibacter albus TaxID=1473156 RepID=A0AA37W5E6_9GAMM|nr:paraquat-inducible protein A [Litoribrevibacter albus]GLQ31137.1 paraquat-inducible protein A [Litoribrevibacter albus]
MTKSIEMMVCHECDLLVSIPALNEGNSVSCPRCKGALIKHYRSRLLPPLLIAFSGLLLFIPANFLPIMTLSILGNDGENTMVKGVFRLAVDGYWWMAILVLFCSIVVPLIKFLLVFFVSLRAYLNWWGKDVIYALRLHKKIEAWGMLDVYLIAILLSYIKLMDMGDIVIDIGLFCFLTFLVLDILVTTRFEPGEVWRRMEKEGSDWISLSSQKTKA